MTVSTVDVSTASDGTLVIALRGALEAGDATGLRRTLVHAIRRTRPSQLVLDLTGVREVDPFHLGTLAAACHLGDDHEVTVLIDHCSAETARLLIAAGVPGRRIRHVR